MNAPARLDATSEEVTIADKWKVLVTVCVDPFTGRPWEVVLKMQSVAGKEGSDAARMAADLGICISRMLQGRPATSEVQK